ncbi:ABC transporter ATP-binding protein [Mongoliimonas terrestris]|uniref:ABC transporter ATP-binding protein n=1 Tax=Mongoliimonas terrestris TaxID=1709001 RepID=UPI00094955F0|nr:ABC transporter ATP-binding protein [Mongoliimonas terrestris]
METSVSVRDLKIAYGSLTVLDKLSIDVAKGEFLVLLGPSGCGKSTLLNAIAGLMDITDGEVWISGRNVTWAEPKDRGIGMVFQSYALYPRMTVAENMSFGLRIARLPKAEIAARVDRAAKLLHLTPLLKRRPAELSGGQRQRVAIGRALVRAVDVFLFDEPLSNLDAQLRSELRIEIKKLHQSLGNTMVYVTHDQIEAMTLADRIAVMKGGVVQQLAPPQEIYSRPANRFVAGFLGSPAMTFLSGTLRGRAIDLGGGVTVPLDGYAFASPERLTGAAELGVRPEHVALVAPGAPPPSPGAHRATGTVTMIEPTGADMTLWTDIAGQPLTIRAPADLSVAVGDPVRFSLDLTRASLFDAETGARL